MAAPFHFQHCFSLGKWLWLSWLSSHFWYQRSVIRIQSSTKIYLYRTFVYCQLCIEKTKIKKKRPRLAHFFKKTPFLCIFLPSQPSFPIHLSWIKEYQSHDWVSMTRRYLWKAFNNLLLVSLATIAFHKSSHSFNLIFSHQRSNFNIWYL